MQKTDGFLSAYFHFDIRSFAIQSGTVAFIFSSKTYAMLYRVLLICVALTMKGGLIAQNHRIVYYPTTPDWQLQLKPTPDAWFAAVSLKIIGGDGELYDPVQGQLIKPDEHVQEPGRAIYAPFYLDAQTSLLKLHWEGTSLPDSVLIDLFYPVRQPEPKPRPHPVERSCNCPIPAYLTKSEWCTLPSNCAPVSAPFTTQVTHLVVHHSAGANTAPSWSAVVNSIWNYHVNTNGWADIGYNWLIAPDGTLFQGRGDNVIGAHFCAQNSHTMGVCLLGTYTNVSITAEARQTLVQLLAWKSCNRNLDPDNINYHPGTQLILPVVCGHRDGCATECPGSKFYSELGQLRLSVAAFADLCQPSHVGGEPVADALVQCSQGTVKIQLPEQAELPAEIILADVLGRVVSTERISTNTAELSALPNTTFYFYRINAGKQHWVGKCSKFQ